MIKRLCYETKLMNFCDIGGKFKRFNNKKLTFWLRFGGAFFIVFIGAKALTNRKHNIIIIKRLTVKRLTIKRLTINRGKILAYLSGKRFVRFVVR